MGKYRFFDCDVMLGQTLVPVAAPLVGPEALLQEMDAYGVEACLFYHHAQAFGPEAAGQMNALTLAAAHPARLVPCGVLQAAPMRTDERLETQVDRLVAVGFRAVRVVPESEPAGIPVSLRLYELGSTLARLAERRVPLLVPCEHLPGRDNMLAYDFDEIDVICQTYPALPVVLLRPRYTAQAALVGLMRRHNNLFVSMTLLTLFRQVESFVEMFGAERILYGSNLPYRDAGVPLSTVLYGKLRDQDRALIAGESLRRLLKGVR